MKPNLDRVAAIWRSQSAANVESLTDDIIAQAGPSYAAIPREQLLLTSKQVLDAWQTALDAGDDAAIREFSQQIGRRRASMHVGMGEIMHVVSIVRDRVWQAMAQAYTSGDWDMDVVELLERWLHSMRIIITGAYGEFLQEVEQQFAERERALEAQSLLIRELSAPIVPIHEGVLVLPLVGAVDSRRASQIMEAALEQIVAYQADVLILDITGVPIVDTGVANYILQMARAVTLLGSRVVLVGIGAEIAQTIVQLGVDLDNMTTLANLQAGIAYALAQQGYAIQRIAAPRRDKPAI